MMIIGLVAGIAAAVSWGVTQALKAAILWWDKTHSEQWWFNTVIRLLAIVVGGACGHLLMAGGIGMGLGAAGGALNTFIVAVIKSRIKGADIGGAIQGAQNAVSGSVPPPIEGEVPPPGAK